MLLSLLLDDGGADSRVEARTEVLERLDEPLAAELAVEYRRERWGVNRADTARTEDTVAGLEGDYDDVDLDELRGYAADEVDA